MAQRLVDTKVCVNPNIENLILNPFSLNIETPTTAENVIRKRVKTDLGSVVANPDVSPLFGAAASEDREGLIADLTSMSPFNPRVASHLYKLSNISLADRVVGQYSNSRTVRHALSSGRGELLSATDFSRLISDYDASARHLYKNRLNSLETRSLDQCLLHPSSECSAEVAQHLRVTTWNLEVEGVTMPCTIEQGRLLRWSDPGVVPEKSILIVVYNDVSKLTKRGRHRPYIGSSTQLRTKRSNLAVIDSSTMIRSLQRLCDMMSWIVTDKSHLSSLLTVLCQEKTDIPFSEIRQVTRRVVGGSVQHRLQDDASAGGSMINSLYNFSSHCKVITDTGISFAKQSTDFTICFQSVILCALSRLTVLYNQGVDVSGKWALCLSCDGCCKVVGASRFDLSHEPQYRGVRLGMFVTELRISGCENNESVVGVEAARGVAYYAADRWASHLSNWETRHLQSVEMAVHSEPPLPSFVNLTEMARMDINAFIGMLSASLLAREGSRQSVSGLLSRLQLQGLHTSCVGQLARALIMSGHAPEFRRIGTPTSRTALEAIGGRLCRRIHHTMSDTAEIMSHLFLPSTCPSVKFESVSSRLSETLGLPRTLVRPQCLADESVYVSLVRSGPVPTRRTTRAVVTPRVPDYDSRYVDIRAGPRQLPRLKYTDHFQWSAVGWVYGQNMREAQDILFLRLPKVVDTLITVDDEGGELACMLAHRIRVRVGVIVVLPEEALASAADVNLEPAIYKQDCCKFKLDFPNSVRYSMSRGLPTLGPDDLIATPNDSFRPPSGVRCLALKADLVEGEIEWAFKCILGKKYWVLFKSSDQSLQLSYRSTSMGARGNIFSLEDALAVKATLENRCTLTCMRRNEYLRDKYLGGGETAEEVEDFLRTSVLQEIGGIKRLSKGGLERQRIWLASSTRGSRRSRQIQKSLNEVVKLFCIATWLRSKHPTEPKIRVHIHITGDEYYVCWVPGCQRRALCETSSVHLSMARDDCVGIWQLGHEMSIDDLPAFGRTFGHFVSTLPV